MSRCLRVRRLGVVVGDVVISSLRRRGFSVAAVLDESTGTMLDHSYSLQPGARRLGDDMVRCQSFSKHRPIFAPLISPASQTVLFHEDHAQMGYPQILFNSSAQPTAKIIDGKAMASEIRKSISQQVAWLHQEVGAVPGLAMIRVGNRKDSELYVRGKQGACWEVGINSFIEHLPSSASEADILKVVKKFNADSRVHGILVQLPLPTHIEMEEVLEGVSLDKDVDGLHPVNRRRLALGKVEPTFVPCTALGCIEMLLRSGVEIENKHAVVIGSSDVVGFPTALLLKRHNAMVTVVNVKTVDPVEVAKQADILVSATGVAHLVRGHWLKPGAVVIDVGTSTVQDKSMESGFRVIGDVCYEEAEMVAAAITPVPGGVGPMTIAMLLSNTLSSCLRTYGLSQRVLH